MKVRDMMTSDVKTCRPETNLAEAVRDMWEADCGALPVVNDAGRVTSMITDQHICIAVATRGRSADRIAVREVGRGHAYTCLPDDDATVALQTIPKAHSKRPIQDVCDGLLASDGHDRTRCSAMTRSATLPGENFEKPRPPCVPTTMRSARFGHWLVSVPASTPIARLALFSVAIAPSYVLFALCVVIVSPLTMRQLRWQTPPDAEMRIADMDWALLRWVRYGASLHLARVIAGTLVRGTPLWTSHLRLNTARQTSVRQQGSSPI